MKSDPFISVIIPNWNGKRHLAECLESLKRQTFDNFETILVDNGSTDGSVEFVRERYGEWIRVIRIEKNLGFTGGNNVGIHCARGKFIVLLNNDTWAEPTWLKELAEGIGPDTRIGIWGSKILSYYQRDRIQAVGELIYWDGLNRARGQYEQDKGQYDEVEEILFPPGCGAMYRKELFGKIGVFDEDFFAYGDAAEVGLRARMAGWKCLSVPKAVIYHKYSSSTSQYSPFKAFLVERNRFWITIKYFPWPLLYLSLFFTLYRFFLQGYGALTRQGAAGKFTEIHSPLKLIGVLIKAYGSGFYYFPRMWKKRRTLRSLRKVTYGEFFSWFKRFGIRAREISFRD
jgi:GT2 family glycosyltransferase